MGVIITEYRGKDAPNYDNIVAYQEERNDFYYNTKLRLDSTEHAIVKCDGNTKALCMEGRSYVFNPNDKVKWPFRKGDDKTYQITYIDAHELPGKLTIKLTKEREIPVGYKYKINDPKKFISIKPDGSYNRYKTWTSDGLQREINRTIEAFVFSKMSVFFQSNNWSGRVHYLSENMVEDIAASAKLGRFGVSLKSLWFDLKTLAESMTDKEFVETRDQVMKELKHLQGQTAELKKYMSDGFNDIKNQNIELTEGTRAHVSAVGEDNKLHTSKEAEGLKDFIAKRDGIIKDILENVKAGKVSGVSSEDIKKYFDITNATVAAEINKLIDKINAGKHLSDEEFVQATKAVECTDPKKLESKPELTFDFILDNIKKDWHASMAADVIYHQLEKWLSKKKITSAMFKAQKLLQFFEQCPEVFDENGECILDKSFKNTGSIEHKPFEQDKWVLLEDVKGGIKPHNGLKCYFALLDNDVRKNDVKSGSKNAIYQCKKAGKYWGQMNVMRHFGTPDSMNKLSMQGLSDVKARQKRLIEITKFFKTGVFETEDVLEII